MLKGALVSFSVALPLILKVTVNVKHCTGCRKPQKGTTKKQKCTIDFQSFKTRYALNGSMHLDVWVVVVIVHIIISSCMPYDKHSELVSAACVLLWILGIFRPWFEPHPLVATSADRRSSQHEPADLCTAPSAGVKHPALTPACPVFWNNRHVWANVRSNHTRTDPGTLTKQKMVLNKNFKMHYNLCKTCF